VSTPSQAEAVSHREQLDKLRAEVEVLREQLRCAQRLATVGTMTAMVAHEFNNILTPIINYAQLARKNPAMVPKAIARAEDGGQRASHICKAILGMTREQAGPVGQVNLAELISETLAAMARDPGKDGIDLVLQAPGDLNIRTRRVELQQVLLNLIINARTAVLPKPPPRRIEIRAARAGRRVVIRVSDNGIGIPPENLDRIFQPFFSTKRPAEGDSGGHGLGLAICRDIAGSLGGTISVVSAVGKGTTFTLTVPADNGAAAKRSH